MSLTILWSVALGLAVAGGRSGRGRIPGGRGGRGRGSRPTDADLLEFSRLVGTGLAGGLNLGAALELAGRFAHPGLTDDVGAVLRAARTSGLGPALGRAEGPLAPLAVHLARAQSTGAALGVAIDSFADRLETEVRTRMLERVRTLPIRLVVPLTLLLLPGFLLVVVAPGVLDVVADLGGGLFD